MALQEQVLPTTSPIASGDNKGLRRGSLSMAASVILATASGAPAYSMAATLALVVALVGFQAPVIIILAFIPILFVSFGYAALNRADPDCGTVFTWGSRVLGPRIGFIGGWAILASFILVSASLAQLAGQYTFLLFGADGIGSDPSSPWVLLVGLGWIALMTLICYRGIEVAAAAQRILLFVEVGVLVVFSAIALIKAYSAPESPDLPRPSLSWFNPFEIASPSAFVSALVMMLFVYWGWETSMTVSEETADARHTPGRASMLATVLLLGLYLMTTISLLAFAGIGDTGIGLANPDNAADIFAPLGAAVFGDSAIGSFAFHLLILMVLASAAACTETTVITLGRTLLSMGSFGAIPSAFARMHPRYMVPVTATVFAGVLAAVVYVVMNFLSGGLVIGDAVSACGLLVAVYYGLTGLTAAWAYRGETADRRAWWLRCVLPATGGVILLVAGAWSLRNAWDPENSSTSWTLPFAPHWHIGGVFTMGVLAMGLGVLAMGVCTRICPTFFTNGLPALDVESASAESAAATSDPK